MQATGDSGRRAGKRIVFVPTMGFLHKGHMSLMEKGKTLGDVLVASIFVNPAQFGPNEDYASYPRDFEKDESLLQEAGVDYLFYPEKEDLYPEDYETYVSLETLPGFLCGASRPGHFRGVATIVSKLFNIVKPHAAVFGLKDYQQFVVIRKLAKDLNFDIDIVGGQTVREPDGLAMSSRNSYLSGTQRESALSLYKALVFTEQKIKSGIYDANHLIREAGEYILSFPETKLDYIRISDPKTLHDVDSVFKPVLMAIAVFVGKTRLIDNMVMTPP